MGKESFSTHLYVDGRGIRSPKKESISTTRSIAYDFRQERYSTADRRQSIHICGQFRAAQTLQRENTVKLKCKSYPGEGSSKVIAVLRDEMVRLGCIMSAQHFQQSPHVFLSAFSESERDRLAKTVGKSIGSFKRLQTAQSHRYSSPN